MTQQHLKPDEIAMLQRAEKATKGEWVSVIDHPYVGTFVQTAEKFIKNDAGKYPPLMAREILEDGDYPEKGADAHFIAAARTDLPTILTRLANERAKLVIAMEALEGCERNDKSEPYAYGDNALGRRRDGKAPDAGKRWNVPREIAERALRRINELEKQS